jgi:hypothetical protein
VVAALLAAYALAGFVIAPRLVRSALLKDIPEAIGAMPTVGEIRINPFLFQVTVDQFSLSAPGGGKLLGFDRLFIDFEVSSIWHRAYSFAAIDLTSPFVNAAVAKDGSLNLMQLRPNTPAAPQARNAPLPAIRIGRFNVSRGAMVYEDHSQPDVFAARLEPINFELREFTTGSEGGKFTLSAASKLGERIEWHGHVSVQPIESDGEFRIDGLLAHTIWEYLEDKLNFVVDSGAIDLAATYEFSAGGPAGRPAGLQLEVSKVALSGLAVRPKDSETEWISVPALAVTGASVDLAQRRAHADSISITGIKLLTWLKPDGSVNLLEFGRAPSSAGPAPVTPPPLAGMATMPAAPAPAETSPWQFDLRQFEIREASLSVEDRTLRPAVKALLAPLNLRVTGVSQDLSKPVSVTLDTRVDEHGSIDINGKIAPQPAAAELTFKLAGLELAGIQPYLAQHTSMTLLEGTLGADGKVRYRVQKNAPALQISGNVNVLKLHTVDDTWHDDFINWERLDILGMKYTKTPDRLDIEQVVVRKPYARVIIEADASTNVKRVLTAPGAAASAGPAPPAPATAGMPVAVRKIVIDSGQANFTDLSVTPNFSTGIEALGGSITGMSSKPASRAKVDLHGSVGQFAPVAITGEFNVLGPQLFTDIAMSFRNMELTVFNPYSGKFAGYDISKGKLTTELHYKVEGRKLDAQHHIVIDQLEFGDKTASKDAVSLPVKLAVSLLKDRNGVIDLNLPVTGSLDDPQFRLAPIIWKVFVNILEKAVTAPFALLGSLFGGGPDIQFIDFQPGASGLDPAALQKARAVAKALVERPQLKIEVPIAVAPELDRPALLAARFAAELGAAQSAGGGSKKGAEASAAARPYGELDPAAKLAILTRLYARDFGAEPRFPDAVTGIKSKPDVAPAKIDFLEKAIRAHIQVGAGDLQALGQDRAQALQQALLADPEVGADRVFLVANDKVVPKDGTVRVELTLQ